MYPSMILQVNFYKGSSRECIVGYRRHFTNAGGTTFRITFHNICIYTDLAKLEYNKSLSANLNLVMHL